MNIEIKGMGMYRHATAHELTSIILLILCCCKPT